MNYIILDVQSNEIHPSMYKNKEMPRQDNLLRAEIIRISAMKLNETFEEINKYIDYINPKLYEINPTVLLKLGITETEINNGKTFTEAIEYLTSSMGNDYIIVVKSSDAITDIRRNCNYFNIDDSWIGKYICIQHEIEKMLDLDKGKQMSLENAIDYFNIKHIYEVRKGLSNVYYTSKLLQSIINHKRFKEVTFLDSGKLKTWFKPYKTKEETKKQRIIEFENEVRCEKGIEHDYTIKCPKCKNIIDKILYSKKKTSKFKAIALCDKCDNKIYHRNNFRKNNKGEVSNTVWDVIITEDEYNQLMDWTKWDSLT